MNFKLYKINNKFQRKFLTLVKGEKFWVPFIIKGFETRKIQGRWFRIGAPSGNGETIGERYISGRNSRRLSPRYDTEWPASIKSNCIPAIHRELSTRVNWFLITRNERPNSFIRSRLPASPLIRFCRSGKQGLNAPAYNRRVSVLSFISRENIKTWEY